MEEKVYQEERRQELYMMQHHWVLPFSSYTDINHRRGEKVRRPPFPQAHISQKDAD